MKFRTVMLVSVTALVAALIAATVAAVIVLVGRSERSRLNDDVVRARRVFEDQLASRQSVLRSDCRVIANEPRLRAMAATKDITHETVLGVIRELQGSLGSDLFLLTDASGALLADTAAPTAQGYDLTAKPGVADARSHGEGSGVWIAENRAYLMAACRIDFGEQSVGIVVIGRELGNDFARVVFRQSGSALLLAIDRSRIAGSAEVPEPPSDVAATLGQVSSDPVEATIADVRVLAVGGAFPGYTGKRTLEFLLSRSLDEALAPKRQLTTTILVIAAVALFAAFVVTFLLARRLSRPVDELVRFTRKVGKGDLTARATATGPSEIQALAAAMNQMIGELDASRVQLALTEQLQREMEIAMRIQTSMLPTTFQVPGLEIAARMVPSTEVGGDYYDVIPIEGGCWIGIGDVAGHGLTAGLEMLMVQSVVSALVRENPTAAPRDHVSVLNHVIYENVRNRLRQNDHITLTLMRYVGGTLVFAGAHEELFVLRKGASTCERIHTPGTWVGAMRDVSRVTVDSTLELGTGDVMVLFTDGVTEARAANRDVFGPDRLCEVITSAATESVDVIRDRVFAAVQAWQTRQDDDISLVVIRRTS